MAALGPILDALATSSPWLVTIALLLTGTWRFVAALVKGDLVIGHTHRRLQERYDRLETRFDALQHEWRDAIKLAHSGTDLAREAVHTVKTVTTPPPPGGAPAP